MFLPTICKLGCQSRGLEGSKLSSDLTMAGIHQPNVNTLKSICSEFCQKVRLILALIENEIAGSRVDGAYKSPACRAL